MRNVLGTFDRQEDAHKAIRELLDSGFDQKDISLIQHLTHEEPLTSSNASDLWKRYHLTKGAAIGGVAGLLAGSSLLLIPGIGPIVAVGALAAALAGVAGGAFLGELAEVLKGQGLSEEEATRYAEHVRTGGTLVAVQADDRRAGEVEAILRRHSAFHLEPQADIDQPGANI